MLLNIVKIILLSTYLIWDIFWLSVEISSIDRQIRTIDKICFKYIN